MLVAQLTWRLEWLVAVAADGRCAARRLIGRGDSSSGTGEKVWGIAVACRRLLLFLGGGLCRVVVDGLFGLKRGDLRSNWDGGTER